MDEKGLGKRINMARKDRGYTADRLSELCSINATYLRQIEGGTKVPSLPVFINICNALKISPDYLLRDSLTDNDVSRIRELFFLFFLFSVTKGSSLANSITSSMPQYSVRKIRCV